MKKIGLLALFLGLLVIPSVAAYIQVGDGVHFVGNSSGGYIRLDADIRCSSINVSDLVYFENYDDGNGVYSVGFSSDTANANITVKYVKKWNIRYIVNAPTGTAYTRVQLPYHEEPVSVVGADDWSYTSEIATLTTTHSSNVEVVLKFLDVEANPTPLTELTTDFSGGVVSIYTSVVGPVFWAFIAIYLYLPHVNRVGVIPSVILGLITWGTFAKVLPAVAQNLGIAISLLAGAALLVVMFFARRRQYG